MEMSEQNSCFSSTSVHNFSVSRAQRRSLRSTHAHEKQLLCSLLIIILAPAKSLLHTLPQPNPERPRGRAIISDQLLAPPARPSNLIARPSHTTAYGSCLSSVAAVTCIGAGSRKHKHTAVGWASARRRKKRRSETDAIGWRRRPNRSKTEWKG